MSKQPHGSLWTHRSAMRELTPLKGSEVREVLLDLLIEVDLFCRERAIPYYLYAGTLLGAARHRGFIPWDDDVDIMMARSDYERFCEEFRSPESELVTRSSHPTYPYASAKVSRVGTLVVEEVDVDDQDRFGVSVDVLPFDTVSDSQILFKLHVCVAWAIRAVLLLKVVQGTDNRPRRVRLMLAITRFVLAPVPVRLLTAGRSRVASLWRTRKTGHVGMLVASVPWRVPIVWIAPAELVEFEGRLFPGPAKLDAFLAAVYGDYRRLPPVAERVAPHSATAYRIATP